MTNCEGSGKEAVLKGDGLMHCPNCAVTWQILATNNSRKLPDHLPRTTAHEESLQALVDHIQVCETCSKYAGLYTAKKMSQGQAREKFCERGKDLTRKAMRFAHAMA